MPTLYICIYYPRTSCIQYLYFVQSLKHIVKKYCIKSFNVSEKNKSSSTRSQPQFIKKKKKLHYKITISGFKSKKLLWFIWKNEGLIWSLWYLHY